METTERSREHDNDGSNPDLATSRFSDDPLPVVYVSPIGVIGTPVKPVITPLHLQIELCDAFARFDEIIVVTEAECGDPTRSILTPRADQLNNIDYIVSGHLDYGGGDSVSTTLRVISRSDGVVVWTRTFRPIRLDGTADLAQDAIVRQAAMTIAQPTGVIQARERNRRAAGAKLDPRYSCLLDFNAYRQSFDPPRMKASRPA